MSKEPRIGEKVSLPEPFSDVVGRVIRVYGTGTEAVVTVEYTLDDSSTETLTTDLAHVNSIGSDRRPSLASVALSRCTEHIASPFAVKLAAVRARCSTAPFVSSPLPRCERDAQAAGELAGFRCRLR